MPDTDTAPPAPVFRADLIAELKSVVPVLANSLIIPTFLCLVKHKQPFLKKSIFFLKCVLPAQSLNLSKIIKNEVMYVIVL